MPVYYHGPMPRTDEERAAMRVQALGELRRMEEGWKESAQRSPHGSDVLVPLSDQSSFNETVHKLMIATKCANPTSYFETSQPFRKNKSQGRPYDGIPMSFLLGKTQRILREFDTE